MRKYLRQVARARMKALGIEGVNRKMSRRNSSGEPLWRAVLFGEYAQDGAAAIHGLKIRTNRKIRRVAK